MKTENSYLADLAAFVKPADLPPPLKPFIKLENQPLQSKVDLRCVILKIRGTIDSYYGLTIDKETKIERIQTKLAKDLKVVSIAPEARQKLNSLIDEWHDGGEARFLNHRTDTRRYPYRH